MIKIIELLLGSRQTYLAELPHGRKQAKDEDTQSIKLTKQYPFLKQVKDEDALHLPGRCCEEGLGGVAVDMEKVTKYYELAKKNGYTE